MGLLKFLIITICILYLLRILARIFLPVLIRNFINKAQSRAGNHQYRREPEGKIKIKYDPKKEKESYGDKAGEFIDYEEIK